MPRIFIIAAFILIVFSSCSHTYYIARHAEKAEPDATKNTDVPLTEKGKQRAEALKEILKNKKIAYVFSTNTIRAKSTAQPTADYFHLTIEAYGPKPDPGFINKLKSITKNVLIIGHSNTIDDIVNMLCNEKKVPADLNDSEYDNLFIVKYRGKRIFFSNRKVSVQSAFKSPAHH
jgi:phosphohistidine phosphatase SixA